jgi:hypothetical protein
MQVRFNGQVTKKEFQRAQKLMFDRVMMSTRIFFGAVLVLITGTLLWAIATGNLSLQKYYLPILFFYLLFTFPWWFPLLLRSAYDKQGNIYHGPIHGLINENEVVTEGKNQKFKASWADLKGYKQANDLIVIFQGKTGFNVFTRALFASDADWAHLAELLRNKFHR